jgi:adenosine deaminase
MMELDLGQEYQNVAAAFERTPADLGRIAVEGIESTWLNSPDRRALTVEFDEALRSMSNGQ